MEKEIFGVVAKFSETQKLFQAAGKVRDAGYRKWDVYAPFPIHGLDKQMGLRRSSVPYFTFFCGISGTLIAILIIWYMGAYDYPLVVGGKPLFSLFFPFPVIYELTILLAAFGTFFGMFITNRLPRYHHPIFDVPGFERASDDTFFISIEATDAKFEKERVMAFLESVGGKDITLVKR